MVDSKYTYVFSIENTKTSQNFVQDPDSAAIQLLDVPNLEACIMDRSLSLKIEFATEKFHHRVLDSTARRTVIWSETTQNVQQKWQNFVVEKYHLINMDHRQKAKVREHESTRSFELFSFRSDIYAETPTIHEANYSRTYTSPSYSSGDSRAVYRSVKISLTKYFFEKSDLRKYTKYSDSLNLKVG